MQTGAKFVDISKLYTISIYFQQSGFDTAEKEPSEVSLNLGFLLDIIGGHSLHRLTLDGGATCC